MIARLLPCLLLAAVDAAEPTWKLALEENFDGAELNPKVWNIESTPCSRCSFTRTCRQFFSNIFFACKNGPRGCSCCS